MYQRVLTKEQWSVFFEIMSRAARGQQMLLELVGEDIGDQIEEDWTRFEDVYFDEDSDTIYLRTAYVDHEIPRPRSVELQEDERVKAIGVRDADGILQILHFRDPLMLESGEAQT